MLCCSVSCVGVTACAGDTDRDDSVNSRSIMMGAGGPGWPAIHNHC